MDGKEILEGLARRMLKEFEEHSKYESKMNANERFNFLHEGKIWADYIEEKELETIAVRRRRKRRGPKKKDDFYVN